MKKFNPEIWMYERKRFEPSQWVPQQKPVKNKPVQTFRNSQTISKFEEVEVVVSRIECSRLDLTSSYADWLKLAYAFTDEFGETGRDYFHRVSRFYPGYNTKETDRQFDKCLKGKRTGVTIKTFFSAAYNAGVNVKV